MKTFFAAYQVTDLDRSLGYYTALGYVELGRVEAGDDTRLVILKFPGEPAASLELVHRPANARIDVGNGF
jgi:lactoylglutathione lyase